ncbi:MULTISPECIES: penicillin-binding protein 2 [Sphingobium]|jgi:penicillin-binding protein 2|nr:MULTISPECIES: penicillin-binding protein 2 [Sphingobium]KAA9018511.1 penicillin-binding protein 2 [Sphingobium limneticum]MBU0933838.1 penicillin-binding protein 2 [Alphaproteobacteria bacterium]BBC99741.1 penicillin-binding protein 2 [Sphingobium sp. YG1]
MKFPFPKRKIVTEATQSFTFSRRAMVVGGLQGAIGAVLVGRMAWISVVQNEKYSLLSESNRVNLTLIPPRRGWIIDRNGRPLANNRTDFRVDLIPQRIVDAEATITHLAQLLKLEPDDVDRIREDLEKSAGFRPVQVADKLTYDQYAAISVRLPDLPGVAPSQGFSRHYPAGATVGHLLGYVGPATAEDYKARRDPLLITPGFKVGKDGLEKAFDRHLTGKPGAKRVEVTARGKIVQELTTRTDTPGRTIKLTIDAGLQEFAGRRLATQSGSVVVIDCHNGDVLALASMPSFDPNSFSDGISHLEYEMLSKDDHVPLRNKTLQGLYPPGSTVKPMVALALLEAGIGPQETINCPGAIRVGNTLFHCHKRRGHGPLNMRGAIAQSCDIYFYQMAQRIGMDRIASMARRVGMGQKFDLPFPSQSYGTVPDPAWKERKYNQKWQVYDTVNATIGQGYMLINPLQMAVMAARLATGRQLMPNFIFGAPRPDPASVGASEEHLVVIRDAMNAVVNGGGTGGAARSSIPGVMIAGKTGTAQVRRITMAERAGGVRGNSSLAFKLRDHALFQGFAPFDNPRYAIACIIEHGGHMIRNEDAPMIASDTLSYLFDPAKAMEKLETLEKGWGGTPTERQARQMASFRIAKAIEKGEVPPPADNGMNAASGNASAPAAPSSAPPSPAEEDDVPPAANSPVAP